MKPYFETELVIKIKNLLQQGKTYKEISLVTNKSVNALRKIKSRYLKHLGRQNQGLNRGVNCHNFNCYRTHDGNGYLVNTQTGKRVHREVMEKYLGREMDVFELVHHLNRDITDNRIENLELTSRSEHKTKYHPEIGMEHRFGS